MRLRAVLLASLPLTIVALPLIAHATGIPFFGPIIPDASHGGACPNGMTLQIGAGGWAGFTVVINNLIAFAVTIAAIFVAPIMIAYAGFLFVVNPANPSAKENAKKVLWSTIIGLIVALAAYLIVDAVLTALSTNSLSGWTSALFNGGDTCLPIATKLNQGPIGSSGGGGLGVGPGGTGGGLSFAQVPKQISVESSSLSALLTCMSNGLSAGSGIVTAITDHYTEADSSLIAHCDAIGHAGDPKCVHTVNSCHYGGSCPGQSYAADIASSNNTLVGQVAQSCGATYIKDEGDHEHVSAGSICGCN